MWAKSKIVAFLLTWFMSMPLTAARADESQQTVYLARTGGFVLSVLTTGEKPCDFIENKLLNDAVFILNSANVEFVELKSGNTYEPNWPLLSIRARSLNVNAGCVWTLDVYARARQEGALVHGEPHNGLMEIWEANTFGISPGDGLTAYVSESVQDFLKVLVNDMHASRKKFGS